MKLPIYIDTQGPNGDLCGDNCPFLTTSVDGGFCILFAEDLVDVSPRHNYDAEYDRLNKCLVFGNTGEEEK